MRTCRCYLLPIISLRMGLQFSAFVGLIHAGEYVRLRPGGLIGRATQSNLRIDAPGISEAHALLTFRDKQMRLMALRGEMMMRGQPQTEISLTEGIDVQLAPTVLLHVKDIVLPTYTLALVIDGLPFAIERLPCTLSARNESHAGTNARRVGDKFSLFDGRYPDGLLELGEDDNGLIAQTSGTSLRFTPPHELQVHGQTVRIIAIAHNGTAATADPRRGASAGLRISVRYDTVHVWSTSPAPLLLAGIPARIISELVLLNNGPVGWEALAREIWPDRGLVRMTLRDNWDKGLQRLRKRLHDGGIREDLVRTDRHGNVELVLYRGDNLTNDTGER